MINIRFNFNNYYRIVNDLIELRRGYYANEIAPEPMNAFRCSLILAAPEKVAAISELIKDCR